MDMLSRSRPINERLEANWCSITSRTMIMLLMSGVMQLQTIKERVEIKVFSLSYDVVIASGLQRSEWPVPESSRSSPDLVPIGLSGNNLAAPPI